MAPYTSGGGMGELIRRARAFLAPAFVGDPYRPAILNLLFWGSFLATYGFHVSGLFAEVAKLRFGPVPFTLAMGALAALWLALPWGRGAGGRGEVVGPPLLLGLVSLFFLFSGR